MSYAHIVVPLDGSLLSEYVLPQVEKMATAFNSDLTFLHIVPESEGGVDPDGEDGVEVAAGGVEEEQRVLARSERKPDGGDRRSECTARSRFTGFGGGEEGIDGAGKGQARDDGRVCEVIVGGGNAYVEIKGNLACWGVERGASHLEVGGLPGDGLEGEAGARREAEHADAGDLPQTKDALSFPDGEDGVEFAARRVGGEEHIFAGRVAVPDGIGDAAESTARRWLADLRGAFNDLSGVGER
ncbi:MAG: universal stress protein [Chloroflexi bacterium]|nr:universal stress protein [Chloroflexota bacterium]